MHPPSLPRTAYLSRWCSYFEPTLRHALKSHDGPVTPEFVDQLLRFNPRIADVLDGYPHEDIAAEFQRIAGQTARVA